MDLSIDRYQAQKHLISAQDQARLADFPLTIVGCGGLGGAIAEQVVRLGFLNLSLWDDDVFAPSNLNRQRFSTEAALGQSKVQVVGQALQAIDSRVKLHLVEKRMTADTAQAMQGTRLLLDGLDSGASRIDLEKVAGALGIPFVHGALHGSLGQVGFFESAHGAMAKLYQGKEAAPGLANFPMTVNVVSGLQVAQALAYALGRVPDLHGRLALIDIAAPSVQTIPFTS